jgi:hypothetical protein
MSLSQFRLRPNSCSPAHRATAGLLLVLAAACGGGGDGGVGGGGGSIDLGTGPAEFPKVQGYFTRNESVAALTCSPVNPPAGGDIAPGAYPLSEPVAFTQSGSKVSIVLINYPGDPPDTGTVDMSGKVTLGFKLSNKEKALREGRQFYVDITGSFALTRSADGTQLLGTGSYENVLREGSATAPVFTTCSRTSTIQMNRTGG